MSKKLIPILLSLLLAALLAVLLVLTEPGVQAQDNGQPEFKYDEPARVEGDAEFVLTNSTFTSNYPSGFVFEAEVSSTGGDLSSVSVFYSHNPGWEDDRRMRGEVDPVNGTVYVAVEGPDAEGIPPWLAINYRWRVGDTAGNVYWSEWFVGAEYEDNTRDWVRYESEDVYIFIQPGFPQAAVEQSFDALSQRRSTYIKAFGRPLSYKPRMILFGDLDTFREWRGFEYGVGGSFVIGQASPAWGALVQVISDGDIEDFAYGTVVHEMTHLYQYDVYESRAPAWFTEGNATLVELSQQYDYEARVREAAEFFELPRIFDEFGPQPNAAGPDGRSRWGYDVGYTFNLWLVETYGWEAHLELVMALAEPEVLPAYEVDEFFIATLEEVLGQPIEEIESSWRQWLGATAQASTLVPTPTLFMRFPPTVTPFGQ